jgi:hypothetical protein
LERTSFDESLPFGYAVNCLAKNELEVNCETLLDVVVMEALVAVAEEVVVDVVPRKASTVTAANHLIAFDYYFGGGMNWLSRNYVAVKIHN